MKKLSKETLQEIKETLEEASNLYYNEGNSFLSDEEFDELVKLYEAGTGKLFEVGALPNKPTGVIDVDHSYKNLVGTLFKANDGEEAVDFFVNKVSMFPNLLSRKPLKVGVSLKFDGNSVTGEYDEDGKMIRVLTRGRNGKGLDLTHVFKDHTISIENNGKPFAIKYEAIITFEDFKKLQETLGTTYANPRSLVSGLLGRDDARTYSEYITLVPLEIVIKGGEKSPLELFEMISTIKASKFVNAEIFDDSSFIFQVNPNEDKREGLKEGFLEFYESITLDIRSNMDFMIDGLVITILDPVEIRVDLGWIQDRPNYSLGLKFPYMEKSSVVTGFEFDYGKSGRITPMVLFEPVEFNGAIQRRVSLANYKRFIELGLGIGSPILVQYRNDTLSYVEPLATDLEIEPYPFIEDCPVCGSKIQIDNETLAYCYNENCEGSKIGRLERFMSKLEIKGIKGSTLKTLYEHNLIDPDFLPSIFLLKDKDLRGIEVEGLGDKAFENIFKSLSSKNEIFDYELLAGIGIYGIGVTTSKLICSYFTLDEILQDGGEYCKSTKFGNEMVQIEGISETTWVRFFEGINKYFEELNFMLYEMEDHFKVIRYKDKLNEVTSDVTYNFCVTGSITHWKNRKELTNELELKGHKVTSGVSKKTDFLINNDSESGSSKNKKAKQLDIPIISEEQLLKLLDGGEI